MPFSIQKPDRRLLFQQNNYPIKPKFQFVEGSFDTQRVKLLCIPDDNHGRVDLCIKDPDCGWNIPIGQIKLFSRDLYRDFKETLPDATKLGEEIARRWNECETKK